MTSHFCVNQGSDGSHFFWGDGFFPGKKEASLKNKGGGGEEAAELGVSWGQIRAGNGIEKKRYMVSSSWEEISRRSFMGIFQEKF